MNVKELRELSVADLSAKEQTLREDLFRLRFKLSTGELEDTAQLNKTRKAIARVQTILRERKGEEA